MPLEDALKVLLGSLTAEQLHDLGGGGLDVNALTDAQRQTLFAALPRPFQVVARSAVEPDGTSENREADSQPKLISDDLLFSGLRLHANMAAEYFFSSPDGEEADVYARLEPPPAQNIYALDPRISRDYSPLQSLLRVVLPNTLKPGDLRWNESALSTPVSLDGIETVDNLVRRAAQATGLELYCDPHYASKPLRVYGQASVPVPARDALRALCVCLTGAWRAMGTTYVLTDDREGVAARRSRLRDFVQGYNTRLARATEAMDAHLGEMHWTECLHFAPGDPGALPPELARQVAVEGDMNMQDRAFNTLPSSLQAILKDNLKAQALPPGAADEFDKRRTLATLGPDSPVEVHLGLRLFLEVPGFGTVQLVNPKPHSYHGDVLPVHNISPTAHEGEDPDRKAMPGMADMKDMDAADTHVPAVKNAATEPTMPALERQGVLCAPFTAADARATIDHVSALGMKSVYFLITSNGREFDPHVLNAGIAEGKRKSVAVHAVISVLAQQMMDPASQTATEDRAVTGETEAESLRRRVAEGGIESPDLWAGEVKRWISPSNEDPLASIVALAGQVATVPDLAGMTFQNATLLGYRPDQAYNHAQEAPLGYDEAARLAFLRAKGADHRFFRRCREHLRASARGCRHAKDRSVSSELRCPHQLVDR